MDVYEDVFMSELNIIDITSEDIEKLSDDVYAEGGPLHYLKDLRGIECFLEIED